MILQVVSRQAARQRLALRLHRILQIENQSIRRGVRRFRKFSLAVRGDEKH